MKNKILISATAVVMSLAMTASAFAAPIARGTGNVDGNSVINSNDASMVEKSAPTEESVDNGTFTNIENGNFDGDWSTKKIHADSKDAERILGYVLQPENYTEHIALRFYSGTDTAIGAGAFRFFDTSDLNSEKSNWEGTFADETASFDSASNITIDEAVKSIASNDGNGWDSEAIEAFSQYLGGIYFMGDEDSKEEGNRICLTTEKGWAVFNWAMRQIIPLSPETASLAGESRKDDYTEGYDNLPANLQNRVDAFNELKSYIVSGNDYQTNIDVTDSMVLSKMYEVWTRAFPADEITGDDVSITADRFIQIYGRRYNIDTATQNGAGNNHIVSDNPGSNSSFVTTIINNKLYDYKTATLQDIRDAFGDQITISTSKKVVDPDDATNGGSEWGFTLEFYTRYVEK